MTPQPDSPANRATTLDEVRAGVDAVDRQIVALVAERQRWVERAGGIKAAAGGDGNAVRDPARVERVIAGVRQLAQDSGASPDIVEGAYRALIAGFVAHELAVYHDATR